MSHNCGNAPLPPPPVDNRSGRGVDLSVDRPPGRRPDYRIAALNKVTDARGQVGAAWRNPDGSIRIVLNPCIVLSCDPNLVITLFPADDGPARP